MGGMNEPPLAGGENDFGSPGGLPPVIGQGKGFKEDGNVLYEDEKGQLKIYKPRQMSETAFNNVVESLVTDKKGKKIKKEIENKKIIKENEHRKRNLNKNAKDMIGEIGELLKEGNTINPNHKQQINEVELKLDNLDDIDLGDKEN